MIDFSPSLEIDNMHHPVDMAGSSTRTLAPLIDEGEVKVVILFDQREKWTKGEKMT